MANLIEYFTMDAAGISGTAILDASGHLDNGVITGAPPGVPGRIGDALSFSTGKSIANSAVLNLTVFTMAMWIYLPALPAGLTSPAGFAQPGAWDHDLVIDASGFLYGYVFDGATKVTSAPVSPLPIGQWVHIAMTGDGTNLKIWVNGAVVQSIACGNGYTGYSSANFYVAGTLGQSIVGLGTASTAFLGFIDDVRIYDGALSPGDMGALAAFQMAGTGSRGAGLQLQIAAGGASLGSLITLMKTVVDGAGLPGVAVLGAAARNGPGAGRIDVTTSGLTWTAPGGTAGAPLPISADGVFLLEDGSDPSKWVQIQAVARYLPATGGANVQIADTYNGLGPADVTAANASAGVTVTTLYWLVNLSPSDALNTKLWLDNTAGGFSELTISSDGVNFFAPVSSGDTHVLAWARIAGKGGAASVWVKRVVGSSAASAAAVLNALQWQWQSLT